MTRVTVLGSGQDGGLPQLGSDHPHDRAAAEGVVPPRTASSVVVEVDGFAVLCDVSPDVRHQLHRPVDAIALTHGHMGHYAGLVHFGTEAAAIDGLAVMATPSMLGFLRANQPWAALFDEGRLVPATLKGVDLVPVPHRAEFTDTVAISVGGVLYLPDIDDWTAWPDHRSVVADHDLALVDATFWSADEVPGRDLSALPHPLVPDTLERFADVADRVVLTHLNHTNPLVDPASAASEHVRSLGFRVAEDGAVHET
ncbi:MAG: MBL fold metallo-hydrolase [Acidimicrobiia bacterium]